MIDILLGIKNETNRKSCLLMAIRSARYLTGRDINAGDSKGITDMETKILMKDGVLEDWLQDELLISGITMYTIAIDCIGCLFERKDKPVTKPNGIKRALNNFSDLDELQIDALADLRNSMTHNFGLATEAKTNKGSPKKTKHKFVLSFLDSAEAITLPKTEWNGDYSDKKESSSTIIGVYAFCNLVEEIIKKVYQCHNRDNLCLRMGDDEARARFTVLNR